MAEGNGGNGHGARDPLPLMVRCPICRKPTPYQGNPFRPFCSERCRTEDQANWAGGKYAVPAGEVPGQDEEEG